MPAAPFAAASLAAVPGTAASRTAASRAPDGSALREGDDAFGQADAQPLRVRVETPENIVLALPLAGVTRRCGAWLIDTVLRVALVAAAAFVLIPIACAGLGEAAGGAFLLLLFLSEWGYFTLCEAFYGGRTLGKAACGLRVVRTDGGPVTFWPALVRNLLLRRRPADPALPAPARDGRRAAVRTGGGLLYAQPAGPADRRPVRRHPRDSHRPRHGPQAAGDPRQNRPAGPRPHRRPQAAPQHVGDGGRIPRPPRRAGSRPRPSTRPPAGPRRRPPPAVRRRSGGGEGLSDGVSGPRLGNLPAAGGRDEPNRNRRGARGPR